MENPESNHRHDKRVEYHFILRARRITQARDAKWDVSTARNISKTGVLFYSADYYDYGTNLEIRIMNPVVVGEISFLGSVVRCEQLGNKHGIYSVAVQITDIDEFSRSTLDKAVEFFMKKKA